MRNNPNRKQDRGVALLVALFALLLLSAIGMGMMFSANTETTINANYREKQIATYAALAGLQEAKDRLVVGTGDIAWPTALPDPAAANVIYIINPASGESVTPWVASSTYADTELCHERTLGITGIPALLSDPCSGSSSLPATTTWYLNNPTLDNSSSSYTGSYKLNPPLPFKWVRIQLKANNNTPFPANSDSSNGAQVCWTGLNQVPLPPGYTTQCIPNGAVTQINVTNGGSNYTMTPTVVIGPPPTGGVQATATATVTNVSGVISGIAIEDAGSGYTATPTVQIVDTSGSGSLAAATATIVPAGAPVASVTLNSTPAPTACWQGPTKPTVTLNFSGGGGGMGATGSAALSSGYNCIAALSFTGGTCDHAIAAGTVQTFTASGGSGFAANVSIPSNAHLNSGTVNVINPGTGYTTMNPTITFTGSPDPGCTGVTATATLGYTVSAVTLGVGGAGYTSPPAVGYTPAPTVGSASVSSSVGANAAGAVIAINLTNGGTNYFNPATVTVTLVGGCIAGTPDESCLTRKAKAHAVFPGTITAVNLSAPNYGGSGYRAVPSVTLVPQVGDTGTGATAMATVQGGPWYSPVMLLTALGVSPNGARTMAQMEVAPSIRALQMPGALTLAGPQPTVVAPDSSNFNVDGTDHPLGYAGTGTPPPGCDTTATTSHPAVGAFDNPSAPTSPSSVADILAAIPAGRATTNYNGINKSPDVENVYGALGDQGTTPSGLDSLVATIYSMATNIYPSNPSSIAMGSPSNPVIDYVDGDITFNGTNTGYGILVVTGNFNAVGNIMWNGLVLVIGKGVMTTSGGGGGTFNGSVIVAQTHDPTTGAPLATLGSPTMSWTGGGGNGIYYDHCWADYMWNMIPYNAPVSTKPLTVLSVRTLTY